MYKKIVKRGENEYTYYYTNVRKDGKVKNIFLSSDKGEAVKLEQKLKDNHYAPQPKEREFGGANKIFSKDAIFLFLGIFLFFSIFLYLFSGITGFTILGNNIIELDVGKDVSPNATVFLTANLQEYSKPISEFNLEKTGDNYYVNKLSVNIDDFDVNLDEGSYTFFLSLVDNGNLVAIKSQDITVNEEFKVPEIPKNFINESVEEINASQNVTLQEEKVTLQTNILEENISFKERITVGKPVKWIKNIKLNQTSNNLTVEISKEARNLVVKKIEGDVKEEINLNKIKVENNGEIKSLGDTSLITGGTVFDLSNFKRWFKGITGFTVLESNKDITLQIEDSVKEIEIEFETPGPYSIETDLDSGKKVIIGSEVGGYIDVLAYTYLNNRECDNLVVYWVNENRYLNYDCSTLTDQLYIEWNIPHLSDQEFYIGQPFSSQNITGAGIYVNTESNYNYRNFTVARSNSTLYCNNLSTYTSTLSYNWYKNDIALSINSSSLVPGNFTKGDLIYCQINGVNSTNRFILDTSLGDFMNGTMYQLNRTGQTGNVTLGNTTFDYFLNGTFNSSVFDLGPNPNMSTISWGHDTPHLAYYFPDNLTFAWDGALNYSYFNTTFLFSSMVGNLLAGNNYSIFPDNNATYFNGTQSITAGNVYIANSSFAVSFWVNPLESTVSQDKTIVGSATNEGDLRLEWDSSGVMQFFSTEAGISIGGASFNNLNNSWTHFVFVLDMNNGAYIYKNGVFNARDSAVTKLDNVPSIQIGARTAATRWNGTIDEVHIWNRNMTAGEINALYNISAGIKYPIVMQTRMGNNNTDFTNWGNWTNSTNILDGPISPKFVPYYTNSTGENINYTYNGSNRYIQYRVLFETLNANYTPVLTDVVMKQIDYKNRIFVSRPENNFSLLYPINNTWTNNNRTYFNLTNVSWLDWGYNNLIKNSNATFYANFDNNWVAVNSTYTFPLTCSLSKCPQNTTGRVYNGVFFDMYNNQSLGYGNVSFLTNNSFTINVWAKGKGNGLGSSVVREMVSGASISGRFFSFGRIEAGQLLFRENSLGINMLQSQSNDEWNKWHMYTAVLERNTIGRLYIDGIQVATDSSFTSSQLFNTEFNFSLKIGGYDSSDFYENNWNWNGSIDEVFMWSRNLSASEIKNFYEKGSLRFQLQVDNNSDFSSPEINLNSTEWNANSTSALVDGNYSWKARLEADNLTIYDELYENKYSDWLTNVFYLDTKAPNVTLINVTANRTTGQVIINQTSPVAYEENLTLRFNLTDVSSGVNNAWIKIWQTVKDGILIFFGWLTRITGDLWEITTPYINATYGTGQINYTIYVNDTLNNTFEYDNNFYVVYADINIISPTYDQILRVGNSYFFNVTELANGGGISNVSLVLNGSTFTVYLNLTNKTRQYESTSYGISYTIPNVVSQYVTLTAYAWNSSIGNSINVSESSRFRISSSITSTPSITYLCPTKTYTNTSGGQFNITLRAQMENVLIDVVNVSITLPNGTVSILNSTQNNEGNYISNSYSYEYNFTYNSSVEGNYQLNANVTDINYNNSGASASLTKTLIAANRTNIQFTSNGIGNFTVKDICSNEVVIYSNASLSTTSATDFPPGLYNLEFSESRSEKRLNVLVSNVTLNSGNLGEICVFNDLSETITPPTDIRAIDQFNLSCYNLNYGWSNTSYQSVNLTYNYTNVLASITHENNLNTYKCASTASCSWTQVTDTVTSDLNKIQFAVINFSVFMLAEDVTVTTVTVTSPGSGGGGSGGGGTGSFYDLDIIEAGALSIGDEREFSTIVNIKNPGDQKLFGISLSANSLEQGLEFSFDKNYIFELLPGVQTPVTLTVKRTGEIKQGKFDVNIVANVVSPSFIDNSKMVITSLGEGGVRTEARRQIEFVEKLFIQNPACKELYELVKKAKASFEEEDYEISLRLAQGAVNACESLLTSLGLKIQKPKGKVFTENVILGIEIFVFLLLFYGIYYYYRRRRFKNKKV